MIRPAMALACAAALALSGCAQVIAKPRVRSALQDAGLSERNASCMADRMVDRLTIDQLRRLEALGPRDGEAKRPASLGEFVQRVRRVGDAEVIGVTASSAALCATGLAWVDARPALS